MTKKSLLQRSVGYVQMANDMRKIKNTSDETVLQNARRHLAQRMGKLRGIPQKIGQIMSMSDDDFKAESFSGLNDQAEPLSFEIVQQQLEKAWQQPIDMIVKDIDPHGLAASLGQVHRATLHDGTTVAIKVAYPGIRKAVMNDLKMLGWLSSPVGDLRRGFDLTSYRKEIVRDLDEELDYRKELQHQQQYRRLSANLKGLIVPEVVKSLSSEHVLVTHWEDGETIEQVSSWPVADRQELARRMLNHFFTMTFDHGFFHGDPNPGNYRFRRDAVHGPSVVLYDYGSVARLSTQDRLVLMKLITDSAAKRGDPLAMLVALGFNVDLLSPIAQKLPAVCSVLFEPFAQPMKFDTTKWKRTERIDDILHEDRWNFRLAGPAKIILLMRAFRGVLFYMEKINEPVSWERTLLPIFSKHQRLVSTLTVPPHEDSKAGFDSMAKHLCIEVFREGRKKVALKLPVNAIEDIHNLIDEDITRKIQARGISLDAIVHDARRSGYAPGDLFQLEEPNESKVFRVFLA